MDVGLQQGKPDFALLRIKMEYTRGAGSIPRKRSLSYLRLLTADRHFLDQPLGWGDTQDILYSYNVEKLQSYNVITL